MTDEIPFAEQSCVCNCGLGARVKALEALFEQHRHALGKTGHISPTSEPLVG